MERGSDGRIGRNAVISAALTLFLLITSCGRGGMTGTAVPARQGFIPAGERVAAPSWEFEGLDREGSLSDSDNSGKIVVLHFWASWCPPCKKEFPYFAKWAAGQSRNEAVAVVPVSVDEKPEKGMKFYADSGASVRAYHGSWEDAGKFGISGIPATVIIDRKGMVAFLAEGAVEWNETGVGSVLRAAAEERE